MSANSLQPAPRNKAGRKASPVRVERSVERIGRQRMIDRRARCMDEIVRLQADANSSGALLDNARCLLTKHWSTAAWRRRADILRTAEWLVGVAARNVDSDGSNDNEPLVSVRAQARSKRTSYS